MGPAETEPDDVREDMRISHQPHRYGGQEDRVGHTRGMGKRPEETETRKDDTESNGKHWKPSAGGLATP